MTLRHGGTLYIDAGKPIPGRFDTSLMNLREIQPTIHFNVPTAFDILVPALEREDAFARHFFGKLDIFFFAGAALPLNLWDRLMALSVKATGKKTPILSGLGCTESAPACIATY